MKQQNWALERALIQDKGAALKYLQAALLFDRFIRRIAYYGVAAFCC